MNRFKKLSPRLKPTVSFQQTRESERIDIRYGDGISAIVHLKDKDLSVQVHDISLTGLSVLFPSDSEDHLEQFKTYLVSIKRSWAEEVKSHYTCVWGHINKEGGKVFGLSRVIDRTPLNRELNETVGIPERMPIVAYIYKDIFYNERMAVELKMLGKSRIVFQLLDTQIFLFTGVSITLNLAVLSSINRSIDGVVRKVYQGIDGKFEVLLDVKKFPEVLERDLVAHLLYSDEYTPDQLKNAGLKVKTIANNFKFRFIKTQEEYNKVLELRKSAYVSVGKIPEDTSLEELIAPLDKISRIIVAYHGSKIVATIALSFPYSESVELDVERTLPGDYPSDLPPKKNIIEGSRLCIDKGYRHSDILVRMFEHVYRVFLTSDRDYIITSSEKKMLSTYINVGFKKTRHSYEHPVFKGVIHHIIIVHKPLCISSESYNPLKWNFVYRDMNVFMGKRIKIELTFLQKIKIKIMEWIGFLLKINTKKRY